MDSYNSQYPLDYYEIGTPYMFYSNITDRARPASSAEVTKFSSVLTGIKDEKTVVAPAEIKASSYYTSVGFQRFIGVVIDKIRSEKYACIEVLIKTDDKKNPYIVKQYIVEYNHPVTLDERELCDAKAAMAGDFSNLTEAALKDDKAVRFSQLAAETPKGKSVSSKIKNEGRTGVTINEGGTTGVTIADEAKTGVTLAE